MVAFDPTVEAKRKERDLLQREGDLSQSVLDGVYLARFDTYETEDEWVFQCRMPNVQLVQIETIMHHRELVIFGKVRLGLEVTAPDNTSRLLCFYRSFPISGEGNIDQLSANFKNDVLTVRLPRAGIKGLEGQGLVEAPSGGGWGFLHFWARRAIGSLEDRDTFVTINRPGGPRVSVEHTANDSSS